MSLGPSSKQRPRILGIDVGATNIRAGLLDSGGGLTEVSRTPLPADRQDRGAALLRSAQTFAPVDAVGVAVAGTIDGTIVTWTANLGLDGIDVAALLAAETTGPVAVLNDATAAGLAEAHSAGVQPGELVLVITVGTGIGGALILDGHPWQGTGHAGEIGHMTMEFNGPRCGCGNRGCWEMLCGGRALDRIASALLNNPCATAADLAAASEHDAVARSAVTTAASTFARGVDTLCAVLAPHTIVVGGGIMARNGPIGQRYLSASTGLRWCQSTKIRQSTLGDDAGMLGAALHAAAHVI